MSKRLDQEKENKLTPIRYQYAKEKIREYGYIIAAWDGVQIRFIYKGETVILWPYTGWHSGKTIKDGRGIENLLKQIKP